MKKFKNILAAFFVAVVLTGLVTNCTNQNNSKSSFAAQVERANKDCPIPVGNGAGQLSKIKLENGYVVYYIDYTSQYFHYLEKTRSQEEVGELLTLSLLCLNGQEGNHGDMFIDLLINEGCGMKVILSSNNSGRSEYALTVEELKQLRNQYQQNPQESLYRLLQMEMEFERTSLPMQIDEGMVVTDYALEDENIVITIELDENLFSIADFKSNREYLKEYFFTNALMDPDSKTLLDLCKVTHSGLTYRFIGNHSKKSVDITLTSNEIRARVKMPNSVNIN